MSEVGRRLPRLDSRDKVTGQAQYIADLYRPNMLHGAILGSLHAHARILSYDLAAALALPGVVCVLTGEDVKGGRFGPFIKDEHVLALGKVRYVGEPVCLVAAEDEATARLATGLIEVEYEELPAVLSPEEAMAPGAPVVHEENVGYIRVHKTECGGNLAWETSFAEGDVDAAWAECDVIVEGEFETQAQAHVAIEPCGALAEIDANGRVTLWSSNQSVFRVQANVCEGLGLPMGKLRCVTPRVGGGFGNKMEMHVQAMTAALTIASGRAVKMILSREEDFEIVRHRHPYKIRARTGAKRDGTLVARDVEVVVDCGAYGDDSPGVMGFSLLMARGPYRIPHSRAHGRLYYTNKIRFGAFRGFGNPQVCFATETQLDEIAEKIGMDPLELRRKNAIRQGDRWAGGGAVNSDGFVKCLDAVGAAWREPRSAPTPGKRRARGIACSSHISGLLATGAIVRMLEDGSLILNTGAVDIGQGSDTVLTQICADSLKVGVGQVSLASPDTDGSPFNWGTTASRVTYMTGRAIVGAAGEVERKIKAQAAEMLECAVADLELRDGGRVGISGVPQAEVSFAAVAGRSHWAAGGPIIGTDSLVYDKPAVDPKHAVTSGVPFPQIGVFSFSAIVCDVEIDEATGKTTVLEAWSACDVGKAINPLSVEGQIEGGFVQGLGFALFEEVVWDGARIANPSLMDYKIATTLDVPQRIHALIVEEPEPDGPFGAKGIGEIPICAVAPAIANGIAAATGTRLRRLPMTPERVLDVMIETP
ncbi:MAG: aldehyde oxidase and xanthine dehydrogenase [Rhodospirillales bacterium]|nr:aldehyde oxidase and xanthine dehydrogenase [Rhodospirillales bacterium]